jgi:hypothetical protein
VEEVDLSGLRTVVPHIDIIGCKYRFNQEDIFIFVIYFPRTPTIVDLNSVCDFFENNYIHCNNLVIAGDFNIPRVDEIPPDNVAERLKQAASFLGLQQCNGIRNCNSKLLDLFFSNTSCKVIRDFDPLVSEDGYHPALSADMILTSSGQNNFTNTDYSHRAYNFRKADFPTLYKEIQAIDWSLLIDLPTVDAMVDQFYHFLFEIVDRNVPTYKPSGRNYPPWFNAHIIATLREKHKAWKKYKESGSQLHLANFKLLRTTSKKDISKAHSRFVLDVQSNIKSRPKDFWSYINLKKGGTRIPGRMYSENTWLDDPQNIVDAFASYFKSTFVQSDPYCNHNNADAALSCFPTVNIFKISETDIISAINRIPNRMTSGPDGLPGFLVRDCRYVLVEPLMIIFNASLESGCFPKEWKKSKVCPVFKSGKPSNISDYRPISLSSNFSKLFEIVLHSYIYSSVRSRFSPRQHGFIDRRSTMSNLLTFSQYVSESLDSQQQVDTIYTDFTKAFDQIDHNIIIKKLDMFGFSNKLIAFFESYLSSRQQYVHYHGVSSYPYATNSGVPQGSVLGPLIFTLFINDLPSVLDCEVLLYADDAKIFQTINSLSDADNLQRNLDRLNIWCTSNKLNLNPRKCKVMTYCRKKSEIPFVYLIGNTSLERCETVKDLGVYFDRGLRFDTHIHHLTSLCMSTLGFIIRNCQLFRDCDCLKSIFSALILSKLEYGSLIWYPIQQCYTAVIENIQRKFLKYLFFKEHKYYPPIGYRNELLWSEFNVLPLGIRRDLTALTVLHKIIHNKIDSSDILNKIDFLVPRIETRFPLTFAYTTPKTNALARSPIILMCILNYKD